MPLYKGPAGYGRTVNLCMNIFLTFFFVFLNLWLAQQMLPQAPILTPLNFAVEFVAGYPVSYFIGDALPFSNWANAIAARIKNSAALYIVRCLVLAFLFGTTLTLLFGWINNIVTLGVAGWLGAWWATYPISLAGAIVCVMIALPISEAVARSVSGFDPRNLGDGPRA